MTSIDQTIETHLKFIYGTQSGRVNVCSGVSGKLTQWNERYYSWPNDLTEIVTYVKEHDQRGRNVYATATLAENDERDKSLRATKDNNTLWIDLDELKHPDRLESLKSLGGCYEVETSPGHLQVWVKVTEELSPDEIEQHNHNLAQWLGGDTCGDISRVMRIPGTHNYKPEYQDPSDGSAPPVVQMGMHLDQAPLQALLNMVPYAERDDKGTDYDFIPETIDRMPTTVRVKLDEQAKQGKRSGQVHGFVRECAKQGLTQGQTLAIIEDYLPHQERWIEHGMSSRFSKREVAEQWPQGESVLSILQKGRMTLSFIRNMPDPEYLIKDFLIEDTLAQVFGKPGLGKTFLAMDWALSIAAGIPWLGHETKQSVVYYLYTEGKSTLKYRLAAWEAYHKTSIPEENIILQGTQISLLTEVDVKALKAEMDELKPRLIVIDTLTSNTAGAALGGQEDMSSVITNINYLRQGIGATALLLHHPGHSNQHRARDSSVLNGALDTDFRLSETVDGNGCLRLENEKERNGEAPKPITLYRQTIDLGQERSSCVIVPRIDAPEDVAKLDTVDDVVLDLVTLLGQLDAGDGVTSTVWMNTAIEDTIVSAAGVFHKKSKVALQKNYVSKAEGRTGKYTVVDRKIDKDTIDLTNVKAKR